MVNFVEEAVTNGREIALSHPAILVVLNPSCTLESSRELLKYPKCNVVS